MCIFELFCTVENGGDLVLMIENAGAARKLLTVDINAAEAQANRPEDKQQIDDWIMSSCGFDKVNAACFRSLKVVGQSYGFGPAYFTEENKQWFSPGYLTCE